MAELGSCNTEQWPIDVKLFTTWFFTQCLLTPALSYQEETDPVQVLLTALDASSKTRFF